MGVGIIVGVVVGKGENVGSGVAAAPLHPISSKAASKQTATANDDGNMETSATLLSRLVKSGYPRRECEVTASRDELRLPALIPLLSARLRPLHQQLHA